MDTSTAAAVAALVVAIVAMFVAIMQALQQYFVSGQLIRLCDSVVFGKMPGRGQRVWQLRQFRFRIVYNVPQVSLKRDLWPETLPHIPSYAKGSGSLPDLGLMGVEDNGAQSSKNEHSSFAPGEASWVSFCRAVQFSSGQSMVLDLIQGDADRCPVDLPNVPMQMSMRDVAVMGLMSGMKCTQASFAEKSLSMQGLIGTITTSQHPLLGPLLHFSPRNFSASEMKDLRVGNGAIDPRWMAHLWDEVVVAGHRYTRQDRIRIERDEATWTQRPRGRAVILANRNRSPPPESIYGLRRRASVASSTFSSRSRYTDRPKSTRKSKDFVRSTSPPKHQTLWTRSDGDWYLINNQTASSHLRPTLCQDMAHQEKPSEFDKQEGIINKIRMWSKIWNYIFRDDNVHQYGGGTDPFTVEIERGEVKIKRMDLTQSENMILRDVHQFPAPPYQPLSFQDRGADLQPRWFIKDYIDQKREEIHGKDTLHKNRSNAPLLIGWYDDEDHEIPELGEAKESIAKAVLEMWPRSQYDGASWFNRDNLTVKVDPDREIHHKHDLLSAESCLDQSIDFAVLMSLGIAALSVAKVKIRAQRVAHSEDQGWI
ncbi:hypothetical protein N7462_007540 [Penicillium macrosclerotiorum]|uniref:uncharacterized protein n=1 Tax=Penicillium macrosclerotiorum TaxID=303699 RepID=UPI002548E1C8|nr:uncharacterized protein N7462_007540 [Penicillium macrosclerotiorum]KAJ5679296.1 hypothetical protein N7462_007540 [Penicillium macrosclerotiorum]